MRSATQQDSNGRDHPGVYVLIFTMLACVTAIALSIAALASFSNQREYFCAELSSANNSMASASIQYKLDTHQFNYRLMYRGVLGVVQQFQLLKWTTPDSPTAVLELCVDCATLSTATCINEAMPSGCQLMAAEVEVPDDTAVDLRRQPVLFSFLLTLDDGTELTSLSTGSTCPFF